MMEVKTQANGQIDNLSLCHKNGGRFLLKIFGGKIGKKIGTVRQNVKI